MVGKERMPGGGYQYTERCKKRTGYAWHKYRSHSSVFDVRATHGRLSTLALVFQTAVVTKCLGCLNGPKMLFD